MSTDFLLPDLGEGLVEAEIVQWHVAEGDVVTLNQTIAEVETAKAVVELPSPFAGTVAALRHAEGDVVPVGEVLISFDVDGGETPGPTPAATEEKREPNLVGYGAAPRAAARPQRRARSASSAGTVDTAVREAAPHDAIVDAPPERELRDRPRSTPPVRKFAKDLGVDLDLVAASGVTGIITREDVEAYASQTEPAAVAPVTTMRAAHTPEDERIPIRGVRKHTAEAMVRSAFTAPHASTFLTVDVTASVALVDGLRADRRFAEHRIGIMAVAAKAVCLALRRSPELNARWDDAAGEIIRFGRVNLGIAAATDRGLVVPSVKDAGSMSLVELSDAIRGVAETARAGKATPADLSGGTFSITNYGVFGVDAGTPILVPGEAGILGLGAVQRRPWEHEGQVALRDVMTLSLSFDHRLVDGAEAARFVTDVADVLREPGRAMVLA
ncbi:2-oxo acid dehydrogenase subunit E2 [Microbacterium sp. EYE_5]|uniref:dihydrolipoamide acetyltransferase family protein n=1 Tax=unclassified Microbacterium TaxID=2609290 RepID=UPI002005657E|nr:MULTISPECIES: dihydrolipoamide acetyltransferase family protein [unclassified Microbacterium]MCK6080536.1 2-oxo acid dehydrogenase subunit E2 [Microbacterium sp. EYE_382]MCK6085807.1 2-oxo acid dehydrogenase subunit E2 [Microbacterium sp. EYE_384]MCK6124695.1 2-oxo acid dehydrogenase subunit E2 [Microbacterium sp. EYE_80]MCK6127604.1 2-oxo acid dehydrogenase subunit E2 [Microbacterium sp. EYE_79]MCK6141491.1 2-oxo acid dehydrogenase subunit E2 [Microbacterium sp. EYE_39]